MHHALRGVVLAQIRLTDSPGHTDDLRASSPCRTGCDFGVFYRLESAFNEAGEPSLGTCTDRNSKRRHVKDPVK